jgi:hypothetical protein
MRLNFTWWWRGVAESLCHGKCLPSGSACRRSCPFLQITVPLPSRMMRAGIVVTVNLSWRAFPGPPDAAACVIAGQGMAAKYWSVAAALRHHDTRTTSNGGMFLLVGVQWACLLAWSFVSKGVNCRQGGHQSALKYRPITVPPCTTFSVVASKFVVKAPCGLCMVRWDPSIWAQWHIRDAARIVVLGEKGGG